MIAGLLPLGFAASIGSAFPPPAGAQRVETDAFGTSLLELPLEEPEVPVRTHRGAVVGHDARVITLPMVPGDLQQCADSVLRVRMQWLLDQGETVSVHATSGDPLPWARYRAGETPYVVDERIQWKAGGDGSWESYLAKVFTWAGTASLERLETHAVDSPRAGDVLVRGGFPGHAVLLLDVARRGDELFVLVGEGYMPAQSFHVELGPVDGWWTWDEGVDLGHWDLRGDTLRRWNVPG